MSLLGQPSAPDFDDPIGLLTACHERILGFCDLLERLPGWIERHGIDDEVKTAARRILHYFNTAGHLHHQDEELDLFPLLTRDATLSPLIAQLTEEHRTLDGYWDKLAAILNGVLLDGLEQGALTGAIALFCEGQRRHVALENTKLLAPAAAILTGEQRVSLGRSMAARRNGRGPQRIGTRV